MPSRQARLDRYLATTLGQPLKAVRLLLARGQVRLNGEVASAADALINQFDRVECEGVVLQAHQPRYLMLNKPPGVVSATRDDRHRTVIDLLGDDATPDLHLAGRLDFNSTGLVLLTNDGRWSRALSSPDSKVAKRYQVTLTEPVTDEVVHAFAEGIYFSYEDITTLPAELFITGERTAEVVLHEGRYHQIKRMFGRFQNEVLTLHRTQVGAIRLDTALQPGEFRALTDAEVASIQQAPP